MIINKGREGRSSVALKSVMGNHASDLTISTIAPQIKVKRIQLRLLSEMLDKENIYFAAEIMFVYRFTGRGTYNMVPEYISELILTSGR